VVPFLGGRALKFSRARRTRLDLGQGRGGRLRLRGAFSIQAVVRLDAVPPSKVSLVSKWRIASGGRSYELGITPSRRLFFTVSSTGLWPKGARELLSSRPLKSHVVYAVAAVYEPGAAMRLFVNGVSGGETSFGVPPFVFDSRTPVLLGNRFGSERDCAFEGLVGPVDFYDRALGREETAQWASRHRITAPPEPEFPSLKPPYDLDAIREEVRRWYEKLAAPGRPYGAYRLRVASPPDLYASCDIAWIRWMMNDLNLTDDQRREWIGFIQDQQIPADGSYRHITGHCKAHAFCHATGALNMLGGRHRYRPKFLDAYLPAERVPEWLGAIDWVNQWGGSHDIWGAGVPLTATPSTPQAWKDSVFSWLRSEVDPATGFWRKGVKARSELEYLGGAFHIWPLYAVAGRPIPYPERVVDSVLKLARADGSFDGGFGYGNMDGVWILEYMLRRTEYRRDEILHVLERNLHGLMALYSTDRRRFLRDAHGTESRIAALAILQSALPRLFRSRKPWRNPWGRRRLFVIR